VKSHFLMKRTKNQSGFTLIEVLIGIAILGVISGGVSTLIFQTMNINGRSTAHMTAVKEVENAINFISRDVQMAQKINVTDTDPTGLPLSIDWVDWNNQSFNVVYSLQDGHLVRVYNSGPAQILVSHFDTDQSECHYDVDVNLNRKIFTMTLTSTVIPTESESRSINIIPRSAQQ
jgi:prepilin-type N-terminal cleavage/methylation domain-containing protein